MKIYREAISTLTGLCLAALLNATILPATAQVEYQKNAKTNDDRIVLLSKWIDQFLNQFNKYKFGPVVKLGNPNYFSHALKLHGMKIVFDPGLSEAGLFYPPEALFGGKTFRYPHLYLNSKTQLGPNVSTWHELLHAIIYFNKWRDLNCLGQTEPTKGNREEAYTWLNEARISWLANKLTSYERDYNLALNEKDPAKKAQRVQRLNKKWSLIESDWVKSKLQNGPAQYKGATISSACVKEFDQKLGIDIDIHKIKRVYLSLDTATSPSKTFSTSLINSTWLVQMDFQGTWGVRKYTVTVVNDSPGGFAANVKGHLPPDKVALFKGTRNGNVLKLTGTRPVRPGEDIKKPMVLNVTVNLDSELKSLQGSINGAKNAVFTGDRLK